MDLQIPQKSYAGYIFDCDGTLADSMPIHYQAWGEAFQLHNAPFTFPEDLFYQLGGVATAKIVSILNEKYNTSLNPEEVTKAKEAAYLRNLPQVQPLDPVIALARQFSKQAPLAIVSGGFRHVVEQTLTFVQIKDLFPIIVTPESVKNGKPEPDMFLLAAEKMGVDPTQCLVFEDGMPGIEGAKKAGMDTVFIPSRQPTNSG